MRSLALINIILLSATISLVAGETEHEGEKLPGDVVKQVGPNPQTKSAALTRKQIKINKKLEEARKEQNKINANLASANSKLQQLISQQSSQTTSVKDQKILANQIRNVEEQIQGLALEAAVKRTLVEQLLKQLSAPQTNTASTIVLTKKQQELNNKISTAQERKENLELETAVSNTLFDELKKQQIYLTNNAGTTDNASKLKKLTREVNRIKEKTEELTLKLALATTTLEQLEKQRDSSNFEIDLNGLTDAQKVLVRKMNDAQDKKNDLEMEAALVNTRITELKKLQTSFSTRNGVLNKEDANVLKKLNTEINRDEEKKLDLSLKLALATTMLAQLEKQWRLSASGQADTTGMTNRQKTIISSAKEDKEKLELEAALTNTLIEELKKQQNAISSNTGTNKNQDESKLKKIVNEINKAEEKRQELAVKLALATTKLEQLGKQKSSSTSTLDTTGMSIGQKTLIKQINIAEESKQDLEMEVALANTLFDELKKQQNLVMASVGAGNNDNAKKLHKLATEIVKAGEKKQQFDSKLVAATAVVDQLKQQLSSLNNKAAQ